jgi:4-diphosphocytidyl-2-C-methyl-D-erythritol kinase
MITGLNEAFALQLPEHEMEKMAAELGSDCAFFIRNEPAMASGRGEILTSFELNLSGKYMALHYPGIHVSTAEAYSGIVPNNNREPLETTLRKPISEWKGELTNDFEKGICDSHPSIQSSIEKMTDSGALYAAMTGSGSAVYGIFENPVEINFQKGSTFNFELS